MGILISCSRYLYNYEPITLAKHLRILKNKRRPVPPVLMLLLFIVLLAYNPGSLSSLHAQPQSRSVDSLKSILTASAPKSERRIDALNNLSEAYQYTSSDSSLMFADQAVRLAKQTGNRKGEAWALYHRNYALYNQGKYDVAMETLSLALPLFEELRDSNGLARTLNDIGNIQKRLQHYSEALYYYNRALSVYERTGNAEGVALAYSNSGTAWRLRGDHEESYKQSLEGLKRSEAIGYKFAMVLALTTIGQYWSHRGNYDSAMASFQRALLITEEIQNDKYTGQLNYLIGGVYAKRKNFALAEQYATRGVAIAKKARFAERVKEGYQTFVDIYSEAGDFQSALRYHYLYTNLQDSLFSVEVRDNISALQSKIATEQKEREIQLLRKNQEIQGLVRNSLFGGVALMLLLLGVVVNRYNVKQEAARQLSETNSQLADANAEITRQMTIQTEQAYQIELANERLQSVNTLLELQNEKLTDMNEEKNEFLGIVAHDLKNPLSGIHGLAQTILTIDDLSEGQEHEMLATIVKSSERMFELINNLLEINSLERGGKRFKITEINVAFIAETVAREYRSRAAQKNITLHYLTGANLSTVVADEIATYQVIENIVSNAVKYSPHGKNVYIGIERSPSSLNFIRTSVLDEGEGISEEDMKRLFGKFARLSARPTGGEHSTGLGLSIVKKMVEAMNGRVWCESKLGSGATFIVELPCTLG
jgi:signal transduction histidine kinase